jgi:hypothetical protein
MARIPHAFATEEIEPNSLGTCKFGLIVWIPHAFNTEEIGEIKLNQIHWLGTG